MSAYMVRDINLGVLLDHLTAIVGRLFRHDPTLSVELGTAFTTLAWAVCILLPGRISINPVVRNQMEALPEALIGAIASAICLNQFAAIISGRRNWRAWGAFGGSIWLGWLAGAFVTADPANPNGYVYLGFACVSMLPFWRKYSEHIE